MKKTYTTTTEKPRLVIEYDTHGMSPREWDNLGFFFTKERNYQSPDGTDHVLYQCMIEAEDTTTARHMEEIKRIALDETMQTIVYITPVYRYKHGGVVYRRGTANGFDYFNCGFYIVTEGSAEVLGTPPELYDEVIDQELALYTKWANGEVYGYTLYDEKGNLEDSCWGFYDLDEIKERLPDEWKGEDFYSYLTN